MPVDWRLQEQHVHNKKYERDAPSCSFHTLDNLAHALAFHGFRCSRKDADHKSNNVCEG